MDWAALVGQKDELIGQLRQTKYAEVADAHGFEIRHGQARFGDETTLLVDGQPLRASGYVIARAEPARRSCPDSTWWTT